MIYRRFENRPLVTLARIAFVMMLAIITVKSLSPSAPSDPLSHLDKLLHLLAYAALAAILMQAAPRLALRWVWLFCALYGLLMEIGQGLFFDSRTPSLWDEMANGIGAALAITLWILFRKFHGILKI